MYKRVTCPKGSLVLWDSRIIHCGVESVRGREKQNFRAVCYVSYGPRAHASAKDLVKKRKAFEDLRMTTHWAAKPKLFGKNPRTYGGVVPDVPEPKKPKLTPLGAGF